MKKLSFLPIAALVGMLFLQANPKPEADTLITLHPETPALPSEVKAIVQQKCYGCHNAESKNEKGKAKLDWDALEDAKKSKALATMGKITEVLDEGSMPPERFLASNPDKKLTEAEVNTLKEWSTGKKKK
ncbi:heme-binding domain-containing protein [Algoriphagus mannitolivorans]|uniref:heme-binding domain-containing protein n=1 Tax=Algoriphagus mannitolivorans TaxID=226504 RepID=UPI0003FF15C9|nr:heme-binding domain-containing protein [Algoriphagus mannitolivorans]